MNAAQFGNTLSAICIWYAIFATIVGPLSWNFGLFLSGLIAFGWGILFRETAKSIEAKK